MKLLCKLFGHKYSKSGKNKDFKWSYGSQHCFRCGYWKLSEEKVYWSNTRDEAFWSGGGYIDLEKENQ